MEEEISATPVILITEDTTQINKSPSDIPIIPKNTKDNTKYNTISASTLSSLSSPPSSPSLSPPLPRSPSSPSSPPSSPPRSSSSFFSRVSQTPLLKRSLTKVFSSPLPDDNINNNNNNREKKLEKKASIFEILSPFNSKAKRERALSKCASSPNLEVMSIISKSKKDCSISIKVFEARNIPEARKRKKITEKNITTIRRAQKMIGEISSPNLMSFSDATDPYCMVEVDRTKMRTRTIEKKLNPFWCEEFSFEVLDPAKSKVVLTLIDDKKYSPNGEVLGRLVLPINSFRDQREREQWFPIQPPSSSKRIPQVQMFIDYTTGSDRKSMFKFQIIGGRNVGLGVGGAVPQLDFSWKLKDSKTKENSWSWTEIHALATDIELPAHLETFQITLWKWKLQNEQDETQSGERQKTILGQVSIPVVDLSEARAYWFCLFGKDAGFGDLRVKVNYTEEVVLTMAHYQEFLELLQEENLTIVRTLAEVAKPNMREAISFNLVRVFEATSKAVFLINTLTSDEIVSTTNPDIIFRGNSLATKSVDQYMKLVGMPYLSFVLKDLIKKIYISQKGYEVDPSKLEKGEDLKQNWKNLIGWVTIVTEAIFSSLEFCPKPFREVFSSMRQKCCDQFPDDNAKFTVVSGFLFLRFFCPAILSPKLFNLATDHPDLKQARNLILIAKTLQNLANLVEFGTVKEEFMKNMNEFVVANLSNMRNFTRDVATVPETAPPGAPDSINLEKELASMYRHILKLKDEMIQHLKERGDEVSMAAMDKLILILAKIEKEVKVASS